MYRKADTFQRRCYLDFMSMSLSPFLQRLAHIYIIKSDIVRIKICICSVFYFSGDLKANILEVQRQNDVLKQVYQTFIAVNSVYVVCTRNICIAIVCFVTI